MCSLVSAAVWCLSSSDGEMGLVSLRDITVSYVGENIKVTWKGLLERCSMLVSNT